jgi:hypothetical protein
MKKRLSLAAIGACTLVLFFQNCGRGFQEIAESEGSVQQVLRPLFEALGPSASIGELGAIYESNRDPVGPDTIENTVGHVRPICPDSTPTVRLSFRAAPGNSASEGWWLQFDYKDLLNAMPPPNASTSRLRVVVYADRFVSDRIFFTDYNVAFTRNSQGERVQVAGAGGFMQLNLGFGKQPWLEMNKPYRLKFAAAWCDTPDCGCAGRDRFPTGTGACSLMDADRTHVRYMVSDKDLYLASPNPRPVPEMGPVPKMFVALRAPDDSRLACQPSLPSKPGWWWNPQRSGRGYGVERQGDQLFVSSYMYDPDGAPVWYIGVGNKSARNPNLFEIPFIRCSGGQTLNGAWSPAACEQQGQVTFEFLNENSAKLTLPGEPTLDITRFDFGPQGASGPSFMDFESGWWWNPHLPGTGYFIENQQDKIYMAAYVYGQDARPTWYINLPSDLLDLSSRSLAGTLAYATGGQALRTAYDSSKPVRVSVVGQAPIGTQLKFLDQTRGSIRFMNGPETCIERYYFGRPSGPARCPR